MAIHALIEINTLIDRGDRKDFAGAPGDFSHKLPPLKWVPVTPAGPRPDPVDPTTHRVVRAADVVTLDALTESWEEVALTQEEADAYARDQDILSRETQAKALYASLDAGTATVAQVQKLLAWLLKREFTDVG